MQRISYKKNYTVSMSRHQKNASHRATSADLGGNLKNNNL